jgi:hypothetical protein
MSRSVREYGKPIRYNNECCTEPGSRPKNQQLPVKEAMRRSRTTRHETLEDMVRFTFSRAVWDEFTPYDENEQIILDNAYKMIEARGSPS